MKAPFIVSKETGPALYPVDDPGYMRRARFSYDDLLALFSYSRAVAGRRRTERTMMIADEISLSVPGLDQCQSTMRSSCLRVK
jgi:hypothetical protein